MSSQRGQLRHGRMLPYNDLVLTVPMSADDLVDILGPGQIADLTACSSAAL